MTTCILSVWFSRIIKEEKNVYWGSKVGKEQLF